MKLAQLTALTIALSALVAFGCKPNSPEGGESKVEFASFEGGYGIDFFQSAAKEYNEKNPGANVEVWGSNRVWEQLTPRYAGGNPPDLAWNGWGMDEWKLIYEGQLTDLTAALDTPAYGGEGKWRDTFDPKFLALGQHEGAQFLIPYHVNVNGWWYNPKLFSKNGWEVPKTYEELLVLCGKIKAKGIAPITFQGKYAYYSLFGFLFPWTISSGGIEAFDAMQRLDPGAWNSPAVVRAAEMIVELRDKGYFQQGAIGLDHTQSQTEFLNDRAAMIPCGSWLYSEMREIIPSIQAKNPDAGHMEFMLTPVPANAKDPTAVGIGIEPFSVPAKAKNPQKAIEFLKFLTSVEKAQQFVKEKGTLMTIQGANDVELPAHLSGPAKALGDAQVVWMPQYKDWYKSFHEEVQNALTSLFNGELTPKQFADRCEAGAEKVRNDKDVIKHEFKR